MKSVQTIFFHSTLDIATPQNSNVVGFQNKDDVCVTQMTLKSAFGFLALEDEG